jgi:hypothetical protein
MAKVSGPLLSISAHGSLAGVLAFRRSPHGHTARSIAGIQLIPGRGTGTRPSVAQIEQRQMFKDACEAWLNLPASTRVMKRRDARAADLPVLAYWFREFQAFKQPYWVDILAPWDDGLVFWED